MVPLHWVTSKTLHQLDSAFYPPQDGEMTPSFGLSNSNTWRWWVYTLAAYRRTRSPSRLAWSEDWRPLGAVLHSSNEPDEVLQWLCRDDSTINIVLELLLLLSLLGLSLMDAVVDTLQVAWRWQYLPQRLWSTGSVARRTSRTYTPDSCSSDTLRLSFTSRTSRSSTRPTSRTSRLSSTCSSVQRWHPRTYHTSRFIFSSFFFNFSVCSVWWTKLATCQLFTPC